MRDILIVAALIVVLGIGAVTWMLMNARHAKDRAERDQQRVHQIASAQEQYRDRSSRGMRGRPRRQRIVPGHVEDESVLQSEKEALLDRVGSLDRENRELERRLTFLLGGDPESEFAGRYLEYLIRKYGRSNMPIDPEERDRFERSISECLSDYGMPPETRERELLEAAITHSKATSIDEPVARNLELGEYRNRLREIYGAEVLVEIPEEAEEEEVTADGR